MHLKIYSVRDGIAEEYAPLFLAVNDDVAKRQVAVMFQKLTSVMADYTLMLMGDFDLQSGTIKVFEKPELVSDVTSCFKRYNNVPREVQ